MNGADHRYIRFTVTGIDHSVITYRNPRRTDWESFRTDLSGCLIGMTDKIKKFTDLEIAANQLQYAIAFAYNEDCPLAARKNNRNTSLVESRTHVEKEESSKTIHCSQEFREMN